MNKLKFTVLLLAFTLVVQAPAGFAGIGSANAAGYDMVVAKDGSGNYTTVQEAINKVPENSQSITVIYVKNGIYKEKINIASSKKNILLIGQSTGGTILTYNDCANTTVSGGGTMGTTGSASVTISGAGFQAENITFENSYDEAANGSSQAVALLAKADKMIFKNCAFKGNQDTLYANGNSCRQYFYSCYIEGDVDFIFGSANAVFDNCEIFTVNRSGGYVAAPSTPSTEKGYLFYNCRLTSNCKPKTIALGRPWVPSSSTGASPKVLYRECQLGEHITDAGWSSMSGNDPANYEMWEYQNTGAGANASRKQLPASKASSYTREAFLSGSDGWNPVEASSTPGPVPVSGGQYIESLVVNDYANAQGWSVGSGLQIGDEIYGDRTFKFTAIPEGLLGAEWIKTACDSKSYTSDLASFTAKSGISVYVGLDSRVASIPVWLSGWSNTGKVLASDNSVVFNLYKKDFEAGSTVVLGQNGASSGAVNYTAIIIPQAVSDFIYGDVNGDGTVNTIDYSLMRSFLLQRIDTMPSQYWEEAGDLNCDGTINSMDYLYLKMYLLEMIDALPVQAGG